MSIRESMSDPASIAHELWDGFEVTTVGFDVGANCGQSVSSMLRNCDKVYSFEPNKRSFAQLTERWKNEPRLYCSELAVSDHDGELELAQLPGEQWETGQLVTPGVMGMEWQPDDWSAVERVTVRCATLDTLVTRRGVPGLVKVDTEGHEVAVLRGAPRLLAVGVTSWLIEFHTPDNYEQCVALLASNGYRVRTVRHPHYQPESHFFFQHGWIKALAPRKAD